MDITECKQCGMLLSADELVCPICEPAQRACLNEVDIRLLNKDATRLKRDGDINAAIDNLEQVQSFMLDNPHYGIDEWLRLPKYLQLAGRFDECLSVLDEVVSHAINNKLTPLPENALGSCEHAVEAAMHRNLAIIFKGKRLICQRENRADLVADSEEKAYHHDSEYIRLRPLVEQEIKDKLDKSRARLDSLIKRNKS